MDHKASDGAKLLRANQRPAISANRKEGHIAQIEQTGKAHHNIESQRQNNVVTSVTIAIQATSSAGTKQEGVNHGIKEHQRDQDDQEKALCSSAAQWLIVGHQVFHFFPGAAR